MKLAFLCLILISLNRPSTFCISASNFKSTCSKSFESTYISFIKKRPNASFSFRVYTFSRENNAPIFFFSKKLKEKEKLKRKKGKEKPRNIKKKSL